MILLASGEIDSCLENAKNIHAQHLSTYKTYKDKVEKKITSHSDIYGVVNVGLLLVKCMLIKSREDDIKHKATPILETCYQVLEDKICCDVKDIKKNMEQK